MLEIKKEGVLLSKTTHEFENDGVLNPGTVQCGVYVHMFYRAVRNGNFSSIGYCKLQGPLMVVERSDVPILSSEFEYESQGLEDPRIVKIDDLYYLTYTAYDGINALGALAVSKDLIHFEKKGLIVPKISYEEFHLLTGIKEEINENYIRYNEHNRLIENIEKDQFVWDKNVIFFPRRIDGMLCFLHRIKPDIQVVVRVKELEDLTVQFWHDYFSNFNDSIVLAPKYEHECSYVGGGCPPIETKDGWLIVYHGVCNSLKGYVYSACVALLELENPQKEIVRLPYALFKPEFSWELKGEVNNVCFPTGTSLFGDQLFIYYGAADERIATVSVSLSALLIELKNSIKKND
jgi:predicted GH43/DUF377 family glycosyl hydrolase